MDKIPKIRVILDWYGFYLICIPIELKEIFIKKNKMIFGIGYIASSGMVDILFSSDDSNEIFSY
jgi:hypothetical protein